MSFVTASESLLQKFGEPLPAPRWVYAAIFFLGDVAFFAEGFASLMIVAFGFFSADFLGCGGTNAAKHPFFDRENVALFSANALARTLDAQSTRSNLSNPWGCYHETSQPTSISSHTGSEYAFSLGVSAGIVGMSYLAHRRGYHRIERLLPTIDIIYDGHAAMHNYTLQPPVPVATLTHLPNLSY